MNIQLGVETGRIERLSAWLGPSALTRKQVATAVIPGGGRSRLLCVTAASGPDCYQDARQRNWEPDPTWGEGEKAHRHLVTFEEQHRRRNNRLGRNI